VDKNVYYSPGGRYSFRQLDLARWRRMGRDAHTKFADPLFVDRESHDYRLRPESPGRALGIRDIDTSAIGLKEDFPYGGAGARRVKGKPER
jgi:hypothetical protein